MILASGWHNQATLASIISDRERLDDKPIHDDKLWQPYADVYFHQADHSIVSRQQWSAHAIPNPKRSRVSIKYSPWHITEIRLGDTIYFSLALFSISQPKIT
jgi:hypothetical protein